MCTTHLTCILFPDQITRLTFLHLIRSKTFTVGRLLQLPLFIIKHAQWNEEEKYRTSYTTCVSHEYLTVNDESHSSFHQPAVACSSAVAPNKSPTLPHVNWVGEPESSHDRSEWHIKCMQNVKILELYLEIFKTPWP